MKKLEEFTAYSDREISPIIIELEKKRKLLIDRFSFRKYKRNLKVMGVVIVVVITLQTLEYLPQQVVGIVPLTAIYALFAPIYIFIRRNYNFDPINKEYRQKVTPKIISFFGEGLRYDASAGISTNEFSEGKLYEKPTSFTSEDLVSGHVDGIDIRMSDVRATKRTPISQRSRSAKVDDDTTVLFQGLYAIAKVKYVFPSVLVLKSTNIITNALQNFAANFISTELLDTIKNRLGMNIVRTGDTEFDKLYTVYCEDAELVNKVLSQNIIQLIMMLRSKIKEPVDFSFIKNEIHIGFIGVNFFEADAHKSFIEQNITTQYFNYINLTIGTAEAVNTL